MATLIETESQVPLYHGKRCTYSETFSLEDDGFQYQIIEGVMFVTPAPNYEHQTLSGKLFREIDKFLDHHPIGIVSYAPRDVKLSEKMTYQPDILYISKERISINKSQYVDGAPDFIIEIISPGSRSLDTETKFKDYETYGVKEYWIIEPKNLRLSQFFDLENGKYQEFFPEKHVIHSKVMQGFHIDLDDLEKKLKQFLQRSE